MLQIKTIYKSIAAEFDELVNEALKEGWTITRRTFDNDGFLAEMEKQTISKEERSCWNCKHGDRGAWEKPCDGCTHSHVDNWEATT